MVLVVAALDRPDTYYRVPRAVHAAVGGETGSWNSILTLVLGQRVEDTIGVRPRSIDLPSLDTGFGPSGLADGLFGSILCSEVLPISGLERLEELAASREWHVPGNALHLARSCASWSVPTADPAVWQPLPEASQPVLLLSGALDTRTSADWARAALGGLPNGTHLEVPHHGHGTSYEPCVGAIITSFVQSDGESGSIDPACLDGLPMPAW